MTPEREQEMVAAVDKALRGGNPDDAARVIMEYRGCSLTDSRSEVQQLLRKRAGK